MRINKYRHSANAWVISIPSRLAAEAQIQHNEMVLISYDPALKALILRGTGQIEEISILGKEKATCRTQG